MAAFVGFDLGNDTCVVAVARQRGPDCIIDIALNDEFKRETPSVMQFQSNARFFGSSAVTTSAWNRVNTISHFKRLLGRSFSDPQLNHDIASVPYKVTQGPDGFPLFHFYYEKKAGLTLTELVGMFLSHLKTIAENATGAPVDDCCIGVPIHFTDVQRRSVIDAAKIAGLSNVQLLHETTAAALDYMSTVRKDFPQNSQVNVAFVDVGYDSTQVSIAAFKKGQLTILSHAFDRSLGGRNFEEEMFRHFADEINWEWMIDVKSSDRLTIMLRDEVRRVKEKLTTYPMVVMELETLDEEQVTWDMEREEFEKLSADLLERLKAPLEAALSDANLSVEEIESLVLVGAGSRVPAITKTITDFFGKQPQKIINATECVARGCAIRQKELSTAVSADEDDIIPE